jgi:hypothetical protein
MPLHGGASSQSTDISPMSIDEELSYLALLHDGGPPGLPGSAGMGAAGGKVKGSGPPGLLGSAGMGAAGGKVKGSGPPGLLGSAGMGAAGGKVKRAHIVLWCTYTYTLMLLCCRWSFPQFAELRVVFLLYTHISIRPCSMTFAALAHGAPRVEA